MSTHKYIDWLCVAGIVLSFFIMLLFMNGTDLGVQPAETVMGYESRLFDTSTVHTIDIVMDDWEGFTDSCANEEYVMCTVVIDGESISNVGIRAKGNTSLSTVSAMNSKRYSFKIEFDQYDSGNSYHGLDKLSLNNLIQDNTMMKDYLAYSLMSSAGAASPLCSYAFITVNGDDWGLYLAVEAVEESFLRRNYGSDYGELYKPDSLSNGGGRGNGIGFEMEQWQGENAPGSDAGQTAPENGRGGIDRFLMPQAGGMGSSDVKLQYTDDNASSYSNIFDNAKTDISSADEERLIAALKKLSAGETPADAIDIEAVIRYFVVHNFVCNDDSYTGTMIHNYYLYEENGLLSMLPWDYNLAFGGFREGTAESVVNEDIDGWSALTDRPMVTWIFGSNEYTELYHRYYREFLDSVDFEALVSQTVQLIAPYVGRDPTKFCTYGEFEAGAEALLNFCSLREESVYLQLDGSNVPVDTTGLDLSDMGSMNAAGNFAGGFGENDRGNKQFGDFPAEDGGLPEFLPETDGESQHMPTAPEGMPGQMMPP